MYMCIYICIHIFVYIDRAVRRHTRLRSSAVYAVRGPETEMGGGLG